MRKILLFSVFSAITLISCSSEDDHVDPTTPVNSVVGVWKPSVLKVYSGTNNSTVLSTENADNCTKQSTYDFKSNGTVTATDIVPGTGTGCVNLGSETFSYSYNATTKILNIDGDLFPVKTLTSGTFEFEDVDYQQDYNNDGIMDYLYVTLVK
ncbi:hypothetical protein J8J42_02565 [Chryseobacterium sp. cx-311]|uniref:lipocalin family protein n=1 Tax=Marnyiella aurantia TaxID=2758037 RepID=UPI001AEA1329|nr:lipocalin family protein [Marnyiella aurantia]MBP0611927.1 hypothetical protein [Marnyiella aurantia]